MLLPSSRGASRSSKRSLNPLQRTLAGGKRKRIDASSSAVNEDPEQQPARIPKSRLTHRSCPGDIVNTIEMLSDDQEEIRKLGWGKFLDFNLKVLESRDLYCWLLEKLDVETMELKVPSRKILPITERVVNVVLGVPMGGGNLPHRTNAEVKAATLDLKAALQISDKHILVDRLQKEIREHRVDALSMKCFFLIVFCRLLFPTTSQYISAPHIEFTMDINLMGQINWCRAVFQHVKNAAYAWQTRDRSSKDPSIRGCGCLVVIYYLDNLDHPLNKDDRLLTPRCNLFNKKKIEKLTADDKYHGCDGEEHYGLLELMSQAGSCYHAPPADLPGRHMPIDVPLMRDLLADILNRPTSHRHKEISKIVRALDTEVQAKVMEISRAHQSIVEAQHKHAAEIRNLMLGDILNRPTSRRHKEISKIVRALDTEVQAKVMEISRAHQSIVEAQHKHAAEIQDALRGSDQEPEHDPEPREAAQSLIALSRKNPVEKPAPAPANSEGFPPPS